MSLERRLYEAWRARRGIRLSAADVQRLVHMDDAIQTRITNAIGEEIGVNCFGDASTRLFSPKGSIQEFARGE